MRSGGVDRDVTFEVASAATAGQVTAAYHAKYDRYGPAPVGAVTGNDVLAAMESGVPVR